MAAVQPSDYDVAYRNGPFVLGQRVKFNFDAVTIDKHPFTKANVQLLYSEAEKLINEEKVLVTSGRELPYERQRLDDFYKPLPVKVSGDVTPHRLGNFLQRFDLHSYQEVLEHKSKSKLCTIL